MRHPSTPLIFVGIFQMKQLSNCLVLLAVLFGTFVLFLITSSFFSPWNKIDISSRSRCSVNLTHGEWVTLNSTQLRMLPEEILLVENRTTMTVGCETEGFFFLSGSIGNQCGCQSSYAPTFRVWAHPQCTLEESMNSVDMAFMILLRRLKNQTMCIVGDSISFQLYVALLNSYQRLSRLLPDLDITAKRHLTSEPGYGTSRIPVNQSGANRRWWGGLKKIVGFSVSMGTEHIFVDFQFYKHYVWSPWDLELMEGCSVLVFNLALHYVGSDTEMKGRNQHAYASDVQAVLYFLSNWSRYPNRVAIWRESLPQHFKTKDGSWADTKDGSWGGRHDDCVPLTNHSDRQPYNTIARRAFSELCSCMDAPSNYKRVQASCTVYSCSINQTSPPPCSTLISPCTDYTLYNWWRENNYTSRAASSHAAMQTSKVVYWPVFDIFDVPEWNQGGGDCSHFCYVPAMFSAAISRLAELLGKVRS